MNKIEQIKKLTKELLEHCHLYYNLDAPRISDQEYDRKFDELKKLEDEANFWFANSPTRRVQGQVLDGFTKVTHSKPMLSAAKTKDINEIKKFVGNHDFYCSYKLDGLTLVVIYENGKFKQAITRGTGIAGEDVTEQAKMIGNLPMTIPYLGYLELRGECVISWKNFHKINETLKVPYSHPRNLAAGSLRQLDTLITKQRNLSYVVFECISELNDVDGLINSKDRELRWLDAIGFETVERVGEFGNDNRIDSVECIVSMMSPEDCEYPVDGLVFELNDKKHSKSLESTSHHEGCRMALKWADDVYETELIDIDWTMGKTGTLTPTAIFNPVDIDGAIVERASIHNVSILTKLDLHIGDTIEVFKANMIIPQVNRNISAEEREVNNKESEYIIIPSICPICGGQTKLVTENNSTVLVCTNSNCTGKLLGKLAHFVSRNALNIDGMSEATLHFLINKGWVNSFQDIYHLVNYRDEWIKCDGFGIKSVDNLLEAIEKSRDVKLENFLASISIPGVGTSAAKTISTYFNGDFDAFYKAVTGDFDWTKLTDFGEITAQNMVNYGVQNADMVCSLADEMEFIIEEKQEIKNDFIAGKVFCVTGAFNTMKRSEIEKIIVDRGGKLSGSVSSKTHYLLTNEANSGSSKAKKAAELGTPIMSEQEFLSKIGE